MLIRMFKPPDRTNDDNGSFHSISMLADTPFSKDSVALLRCRTSLKSQTKSGELFLRGEAQ